MPQFYAEVLRGVAARNNNGMSIGSNSPTFYSGTADAGVTGSSNGDIVSFSGTDATHAWHEFMVNGAGVSNLQSTTTFPNLVARLKGTGTVDIVVVYSPSGTSTNTVTLTPGKFTTVTIALTTGKNGVSEVDFKNQSVAGTIQYDYIAQCGNTPIQLSQTDLSFGTTVPGSSQGAGYTELRLNNRRGKFVSGGSGTPIGYGDHLHVYLGQGSTLFHAYGGIVEYEEPIQPSDEMVLQSRGFGVALQETVVENQPTAAPIYTSQTPQQIFNDFIDNHVNNATKNGVGISSNYQITRSFVQNIGSSIPLYISQFKTVWDSMKEIGDLTVAQGSPGVFFVDAAENLHYVPLGAQGVANWTTDPFPANYGTTLVLGTNLVTYKFRRDIQSLRNRVHYFGVSQNPGKYGAWTEQTASSWGNERMFAGSTTTFTDDSSVLATGKFSVKCVLANGGSAHNGGAMFYPSAKNLGLNISSLGSVYAPPLFDFYIRLNNANNCNTIATNGFNLFFATDASNRFEYNFVADGSTNALQSILGIQGLNNITANYWYHVLLPIGPNGGVLFNSTPVANTVAPTIYTGASQFQRANVGSPSWSNINYIGFYYEDTGGCPNPSSSVPFWFNGWRVIGGRYLLAYDNRASRYADMREVHYFDPISKDDTALLNYAKAELKRLWNPIVRGTVTTPLLADAHPEQQVPVTTASANYSNTSLRISSVTHRYSGQGMLTEFGLNDDFTNSQPLDLWKLTNALLQMGENAIISREVYDLKTAILDPTFSPQLVPVT